MTFKKRGVDTRNCVDSVLLEITGEVCECDNEPPGFIFHGVIFSRGAPL